MRPLKYIAIMHRLGWLLFVTLIFISAQSCVSRKLTDQSFKISADEARSDISLLKKILEANHPSLTWYTTQDSLDAAFTGALGRIQDSVTEKDLKNSIAAIIQDIHCGHTSVRFSKAYNKFLSLNTQPQFPLMIKTWNDTMVIIGNRYATDSVLTRGTIITSINGKKNRELLDSMFKYVSTDGYSNNFKSQLISFNFPSYYRNIFEVTPSFRIGYLDSTGAEKFSNIAAYTFKRDSANKREMIRVQRREPPNRRDIRTMELLAKRNMFVDSNKIAYMRLNTFSNARLRSFFKDSFKQLKQEKVKDLIIDLRENGGGSIGTSAVLSRYITDKSFRLADTVSAKSRKLKYGEYIRPSLIYRISMLFTSRKHSDKRYHFGYLERHVFNPKKKYHYKGDVYLLQGGYTFSASTMFVNAVKDQANVFVAGEESGGGSYGNSAVHLPTITLPNSRIRITLPLFRVVFSEKLPKTGRGIFPEISIPPSIDAIRNNYDVKMKTVEDIILTKRQSKSTSSNTSN